MNCSGQHYESLLQWTQWSHVCSPHYELNAADLTHFMLACTQIYLELEPLLRSHIDFVIGLPQFCVFFRQNLATPLRTRFPKVRPRHTVLQKLTLVFPRTDELADSLANAPRYSNLDAHAYVAELVEQSLTLLTTECPALRSVTFIMAAGELTPYADEITIPHPDTYIDWILRFKNLKHCTISYSAGSINPDADYVSLMYRKQLGICEQIVQEMVTGTALADPVEAYGKCPTFLIEETMFKGHKAKPRVTEYCERVARCRHRWWEGLSVEEMKAVLRDEAYKGTLHRQA